MISIHSRHMLNGLTSHRRLLSCIRTPSGIESGVCRPHWRAMAVHKAKSGCTEAHHDTPNLPPYLRLVSPGVCTLALHVKPNAKDSAISSADGKLNVSIHAAPRDGEANSAITRYMAEVLGLRKAQVSLMVGSKSREKVVRVEGATPDEILAALHKAVPSLADGTKQSQISSFFKRV
ncbi:hypothetical protein ACKKBG_A36045 [Auxenochlorella protothecoides x Auxenochlorella symbiontica]